MRALRYIIAWIKIILGIMMIIIGIPFAIIALFLIQFGIEILKFYLYKN